MRLKDTDGIASSNDPDLSKLSMNSFLLINVNIFEQEK